MNLYINDTAPLPFGTADLQLSQFQGENTIRVANPWDILSKVSIAEAKTWRNQVIESADLQWRIEIEEVNPVEDSLALVAYRIRLVCLSNENLFLQQVVE